MKLSVVCLVVLVASACANDEEEADKKYRQEMAKKCLKEADTTREELQKCHKEKKQCPKADCFLSCIIREHGFINNDGTIDTNIVEEKEASLIEQGHPKSAKAMKKCFVNPPKKLKFCDVGPVVHGCMEKEPHD